MTRFTQTRLGPGGKYGLGVISGYPVTGYVTSLFGATDQYHPNGHSGVDIGGVGETTVVRAPAPATVVDCFLIGVGRDDWEQTFGNSVILDHGDCYTLYAHLSLVSVREGQKVNTGDRIGVTGNTGYSSGAHLHWGMAPKTNRYHQRAGGLLNPLDYIGSPEPEKPSKASIADWTQFFANGAVPVRFDGDYAVYEVRKKK